MQTEAPISEELFPSEIGAYFFLKEKVGKKNFKFALYFPATLDISAR